MKLLKVSSDLPKIYGADKSQVQFELEIQRQRILYILHYAIEKMEIMAALPILIENEGELLKPFLEKTELDFVLVTCYKYTGYEFEIDTTDVERYSQILDKITLGSYESSESNEALTQNLLGSLIENEKIDYHISQVILVITKCKPLLRWLEKNEVEVDEPTCSMIDYMRQLKDLIYEKLLISSKKQLENDQKLRIAFKSNYMLTQNIMHLQEQMNQQQKEMGTELEEKQTTLNKHLQSLEKIRAEFQVEIVNKVNQSEKQMMEDAFTSEIRQSELEIEANWITEKYKSLLDSNLLEEGQLRAKRSKIESQLSSWLAKYDSDVGDKQEELEKLEHELETKQAEFDELMTVFDEQAKEYDILMNERDEEEKRLFEEKMIAFIRNRSAKIIQRTWREHHRRKLLRKKQKKGAKGKGKGKGKGKETGTGKKSKKEKKEEQMMTTLLGPKKKKLDKRETRRADMTGALQEEMKHKDVFDEIDTTKTFGGTEVTAVSD